MASKQGVSAECGDCLGELISCGKQCSTECCLGTCPTSAACQSCSNEKCVPSFEACAGVIPPDARETALSGSDVAPANLSLAVASTGGACVDQPGWDTDFDANMYTCGLQSFGLMPQAGSCMASKQGVSAECGDCLGELISCGKQCSTECCLGTCPTSAACRSCNNEKCVPSFEACTGPIPEMQFDPRWPLRRPLDAQGSLQACGRLP